MENLNIEKFNPTVIELKNLVVKSKDVDITDLVKVKEVRIELKNARVAITKQGKEYRQQALDFQKAVIAKEKELVAIIEPEELRLEQIEEKAKIEEEKKKRLVVLPERKEKLNSIGDNIQISDDEILAMDSNVFIEYSNKRIFDKNEKDRLAIEERERKLKEEENKIQREKEIKEAQEKARIEERERLEKQEIERKIREEFNAKAEQARIQKEQELEQERIRKDKKVEKFLKDNGYTEKEKDNFIIQSSSSEVILFKKVGKIKF